MGFIEDKKQKHRYVLEAEQRGTTVEDTAKLVNANRSFVVLDDLTKRLEMLRTKVIKEK